MQDKILFKSSSIYSELEEFDYIDEFDFHVVKLSQEKGSSYMTVLPISSLDYRKKNNSTARVELRGNKTHVIFDIFDDWNEKYQLHIPREMSAKIVHLRQLAADLGLVIPSQKKEI